MQDMVGIIVATMTRPPYGKSILHSQKICIEVSKWSLTTLDGVTSS